MTSDDSGIFEVPPLPTEPGQSPPPPFAQRPSPPPPVPPAREFATAPDAPAPATKPASTDAASSITPPQSQSQSPTPPQKFTPGAATGADDDFTLPAVEEKAVRLTGVLWSPPTPSTPTRPPTSPPTAPPNERTLARSADSATPTTPIATDARTISPAPNAAIRVRIDHSSTSKTGRSITLSARKLDFPTACACCGGPPNAVYDAVLRRTRGKHREDRVWSVPYCSNCIAHVERAARLAHGAIGIGCVSGAAMLAIWWTMGAPLVGLLVAVIAGVGAWGIALAQRIGAIRRSLPPRCAAIGPAVRYQHFRGAQHRIYFANSAYADEFERLNAKKVVASDEFESRKQP